MKRITFLLIGILYFSICPSQTLTDALRYSMDNTQGTARFGALSGAFGALGGDLSAMGINPAGSSVFLQNQTGITFSIDGTNNKANYFNTSTEVDQTDFSISNAGGVFVFNNRNEESSWKKFTLGLNYNNLANFEDEVFVAGRTPNSIVNFFLGTAQGVPLDLLQTQSGESISDLYAYLGQTEGTGAQNAFLAYQGYLIDPVEETPNNTAYVSNLGSGTYNQEFYGFKDGYQGKYTFNFSTQYTETFYFGINLNAHFLEYQESTFFSEKNTNPNSAVKNMEYENHLSVLGDGFSFQLGGIAKISDAIRFGLSYDSPTWLILSEETAQFLSSTHIEDGESIYVAVDPRVINVFDEYKVQTPSKIAASTAYVFGKYGLLSFEYAYKDYSSMKLKPSSDPYFSAQNNTIESLLKGSSTFRLGGELRLNQVSLRGGFLYEESPFKNTHFIDHKTGASVGIGYNGGSYNLDVSYSRSEQKRSQSIYLVDNTSQIENTSSSLLFSLNINL